ncbi:MFS transporter [Streptomyces lasalocidi]
MEALSGLLLGLFAAILSSTIVTNALPTIIKSIGGGQSAYTWVVTAALLAMTASVPLWGKLADLVSKKALVQISLVIYVIGSVVAGLAQNPAMLISARVIQGLGAERSVRPGAGHHGRDDLPARARPVLRLHRCHLRPRDRRRPAARRCHHRHLLARLALLPVRRYPLRADRAGRPAEDAAPAGRQAEGQGRLDRRLLHHRGRLAAAGLGHLRQRQVRLAVLADVHDGGRHDRAGAAVRVHRDQGRRADHPAALLPQPHDHAGLAGLPVRRCRHVRGHRVLLAVLPAGPRQVADDVRRHDHPDDRRPVRRVDGLRPLHHQHRPLEGLAGRRRRRPHRGPRPARPDALRHPVLGAVDLHGAARHRCRHDDAEPGAVHAEPGRPARAGRRLLRGELLPLLGGAVGVGVLGSVMSERITHHAKDTITQLSPQAQQAAAKAVGNSNLPDMNALPTPVRTWLEGAYGHGIADVFLYAAPFALIAFITVLFIKEVPLRTSGALAQAAQEKSGAVTEAAAPVESVVTTVENAMNAEQPAQQKVPSWATPVVSDTSAVSLAVATAAATAAAPVATAVALAEPGSGGSGGTPVHGFVRGAESAPVPQAAVTLISLTGRQLGRAVAQGDGSYSVDAPGTGSYVLIASADGYQPQASTIVVGGEPLSYDILLSGTSGLTGVVRAAGSALPVKDAMVIVTDVRGDLLATAATGEQGQFAFTDLVPGTVTLAVNASGFRPRALPIEVGTTGLTRIEIDLDAGAQLQGVVRAPHGPLADARVTLVDQAGNVVGTATTGADGAYAFTDLDSGEYTVIATGYPPVATALTVAGAGVDGHQIELAHPGE